MTCNIGETNPPYLRFKAHEVLWGNEDKVTEMNKILKHTAGALVVLAPFAVAAPASAGSFNAVVEKVLMNQQDGPVAKLPEARKRELVSCVNGVLASLPNGKKRYIAEAASFDQMQDRFGEVVMENRAEWKQKIAKSCARIAMA